MKLRLRISRVEFPVEIKPGRVPEGRLVLQPSLRDSSASREMTRIEECIARINALNRQAVGRSKLTMRGRSTGGRIGRVSAAGDGRCPSVPATRPDAADSSGQISARRAFTLIELLTVIAIIGLIAVLSAPVFKQFSKSDVTEAATRQMLDDCARARQLAIANHTTVYMVFVPTNFWNDVQWANVRSFAPGFVSSQVVTQMYGSQWNGYFMESLRNIGDQPGRPHPQNLVKVTTLPDGSFIAPLKFSAPIFLRNGITQNSPFVIQSNYPVWRFSLSTNLLFPSVDVLTNVNYASAFQSAGGLTLPYIAFNYEGQLVFDDGTLMPVDEYIPLAYGTVLPPRSATSKSYVQGLPNVTEVPAGNSTNISYNLIHIDRITGRARLERQNAL